MKSMIVAAAALAIAGAAFAQPTKPQLSLTRLDCGTGMIKDFNAFFSDSFDYRAGPREITNSCYLIRQGQKYLLWDTGFPAGLKGKPKDMGPLVASVDKTIVEQLATLRLKPADITVVGISHMHGDHVGQASAFPAARLVMGKRDLELTKGKDDPFGPWRRAGVKVTTMDGRDVDIFGDGSVIAMNLPGHTPGHMALLVKLASGPVLLSGDLYHSDEARVKRGIPPFNTSRADTLASIDRFERVAENLGARVIIQHEPADIAKLPAFPAAAQ